jgi:hypothetical protein
MVPALECSANLHEPRHPWDSLDAGAMPAQGRSVVGGTWRSRAQQEHLAVGAFALLAYELAADGCEPIVLDLVTRAANDELRHMKICRRVAIAMLGKDAVPAMWRGVPKVPRHAGLKPETRVLLHVVEMCCLSETITGVYFTEMLARTTDSVVRTAIESLLEDEIDHGRVGWAYLATRARAGRVDGLAEALPALLDRTVGRTLRDLAGALDDDASWSAFGWLGRSSGTATVRRALQEVILPGFETLGVGLASSTAPIAQMLGGPS